MPLALQNLRGGAPLEALVLSQQQKEKQPFQLEAHPPRSQRPSSSSGVSVSPPTPDPPHSCLTGSTGLDKGLKRQTDGEIIFPGMQVSTTTPAAAHYESLPPHTHPRPQQYPSEPDTSSFYILGSGSQARFLLRSLFREQGQI